MLKAFQFTEIGVHVLSSSGVMWLVIVCYILWFRKEARKVKKSPKVADYLNNKKLSIKPLPVEKLTRPESFRVSTALQIGTVLFAIFWIIIFVLLSFFFYIKRSTGLLPLFQISVLSGIFIYINILFFRSVRMALGRIIVDEQSLTYKPFLGFQRKVLWKALTKIRVDSTNNYHEFFVVRTLKGKIYLSYYLQNFSRILSIVMSRTQQNYTPDRLDTSYLDKPKGAWFVMFWLACLVEVGNWTDILQGEFPDLFRSYSFIVSAIFLWAVWPYKTVLYRDHIVQYSLISKVKHAYSEIDELKVELEYDYRRKGMFVTNSISKKKSKLSLAMKRKKLFQRYENTEDPDSSEIITHVGDTINIYWAIRYLSQNSDRSVRPFNNTPLTLV